MMVLNLKKPKVSVLILTHNRPNLFKRCLKSVLYNKPDFAEILVNNDSCDIEELQGAIYYYKKHDDLSDTYKFLFDKAKGEYIYFLEDDDYVSKDFWNKLIYKNTVYLYIPEDIKILFEIRKSIVKNIPNKRYFQLGQIFFKKTDLIKFPSSNNIYNDWELFNNINTEWNYSTDIIYHQTTDGQDNISFSKLNKDERFNETI